jgi:eukaryotic-like serine/threonine-protein kinase
LKLIAGSILGTRYRLSHRLGEGGMGQVWSAVHVVTGRRVAVKRLLLVGGDDDDEHADGQARARFILEAQTASAVEHPNVVQVLDFVEPANEPPLLVMELLQGETLSAKLEREQALSLEDTVAVLLPVVSAVGTAHALGIIHRDLKPANIFLQQREGQEQVVKVLDFGIAKWVAQQPAGTGLRTQTGSTLGTPCYMAPEQAIGERSIDHTVDVWSIGIILYECLAGARPVEGENAVQMVMRLLNTGIMPIERVVPTLPDEIAKLIGRMLSRDAAGRPTDLREVFDVLRKHSRVSAPAFAGPSLAIDGDSIGVPARPRSATAASSNGSPAIDAHAATLRDDATISQNAPSWEGQSVSAKSAAVSAASRRSLLLAFGLPALGLGGYLLFRQNTAPTARVPTSSSAIPASVAPAPSPNNRPATVDRVPTASVAAPPTPAALADALPRASVAGGGGSQPKAHAAKSAAKANRPAHASTEDEDGTSDRK